MAWRYTESINDMEFVSADMLFDSLDLAEEAGSRIKIAKIGLEAIALEASCENDEAIAFQEVWETASRMLAS